MPKLIRDEVVAVFEYLRISLGKPDQKSMFGSDGRPYREINRREYLERIFSPKRLDFEYYNRNYSFIQDGFYGDVLVGRVGKQVIEPIHRGPDQAFAIEMSEDWKPAWTFIDFSSDSQLAVVQTGIASPKSLLRALFDRIESSMLEHEYDSYIEYVSEKSEFWDAVKKNIGKLTRMDFLFVPPNALNLEDRIRSIVEAAKEVGADTTKFSHSNPDGGLKPEGEYVAAALDVTLEGAGSALLKVGKKTVFSSGKNRKTKDIPNEEIPQQKDDAAIKMLIEKLEVERKRE